MSAPGAVRLEWDGLQRVEDRLWFLAEVLKHTAGLKPHQAEGGASPNRWQFEAKPTRDPEGFT